MKTVTQRTKALFFSGLVIVFLLLFLPVKAELKPRERNILTSEAKAIDLSKVMISDNSWNKLPGYKERQFWESLPANIRQDYIKKAEGYLDYNWPVVKATDYLEFIRSGDRRQSV